MSKEILPWFLVFMFYVETEDLYGKRGVVENKQFSAVYLQFFKKNVRLSNTFWLYQHGVRNA